MLYLWDYVDRSVYRVTFARGFKKANILMCRRTIAHEEVDDIVGVAFVTPKANIFNKNVNCLLIISTVRQVKIIAMEYSSLTSLKVFETGMSTTTSGVNMKTIVGTKFGHIFMLGNDGNIWELDYRVSCGFVYPKSNRSLMFSCSKRKLGFKENVQRNYIHLVVHYLSS